LDDNAQGDVDTGSESDLEENVVDNSVQVGKKEKRPKKRPKLAEASEDIDMESDVQTPEPSLEKIHRPQSPEATLPSFPLPTLPNAPSKTDLALQGLDQALIDAEIVDPGKLMAIPEGESSGGTGLSEKTRKRLKDLGITELFAGVHCIRYSYSFH
jgi:ATP-dependent RNA helicase DDX51/DBP6